MLYQRESERGARERESEIAIAGNWTFTLQRIRLRGLFIEDYIKYFKYYQKQEQKEATFSVCTAVDGCFGNVMTPLEFTEAVPELNFCFTALGSLFYCEMTFVELPTLHLRLYSSLLVTSNALFGKSEVTLLTFVDVLVSNVWTFVLLLRQRCCFSSSIKEMSACLF